MKEEIFSLIRNGKIGLNSLNIYFINKYPEICLEAVRQNGTDLRCVPEELKTEKICLEAVKQDGEALEYVPEELKTEKLCLEAVRQNGSALRYVPEELRTKEIYLEAVRQNGNALKYFPKELKIEKICLIAVRQDGGALYYVPKELRTKEIYLEAVRQNGSVLCNVPEELKTKELCLEAIRQNGSALYYVPGQLKTKELCLIAVRQNGGALEDVPEELKTEKLCLIAVRQNGNALGWVPEKLKTEELCLIAVRQNGGALEDVPEELKTEKLCLIAVRQNGNALYNVPKELKTEELCLTAVRQNGYALEYVPKELKTEEIYLEAVRQNGHALKHVPKELKTKEICLEAVRQDGRALYYVPEELKTEELCLIAVRQNGGVLCNVPEKLKTEELCLIAARDGRALYYVPPKYLYKFIAFQYAIKKINFELLKEKEVCELYDLDSSLMEQIINNSIVGYSNNYTNENFIDFLKKMQYVCTNKQISQLMQIPKIIKKIDNDQITDDFNSIYEKTYKLNGEFSYIVELLNNLDLPKKYRYHFFKEFNDFIDNENFEDFLSKFISNTIYIEKDKIDKNIQLVNSISNKITKYKINTIHQELIDKTGPFGTQAHYVIEIIVNSLEKSFAINHGKISDNFIDLITEELSRKKQNGNLYYSFHVQNLKEDIINIATRLVKQNETLLNKTLFDMLRETKSKIGQGWIRKSLEVKQRFNDSEYKEIIQNLGFDIEKDTEYLLKPNINAKQAYEVLKNLNLDNVFSFEKMEKMFSSINHKQSDKANEFFQKYLIKIANDPNLYIQFPRLYHSFDHLYSLPNVRMKLEQGLATPEYLLDILDRQIYENVQKEDEEFARISKENKLTQAEYEKAIEVYKKASAKIGTSIPPVKTKTGIYRGRILRTDDPLVVLAGNVTNCCQKVGDVGEASMLHSAYEKNGAIFLVEELDINSGEVIRIIAQSWVWRNKNLMCFDNIEIPVKFYLKLTLEEQKGILETYQKAAELALEMDQKFLDNLLKNERIKKEIYEEYLLRRVTVGTGYNRLNILTSMSLEKDNHQEKPMEVNKLFGGRSLWVDSSVQLILAETTEAKQPITQLETDNLSILYQNEREIVRKKGLEISDFDIQKIKEIENTVFREEQKLLNSNECVSVSDVSELYSITENDLELITNKENEWYILFGEREDSFYIADLALIGGIHSENNNIKEAETRISTLEIAAVMYKKFIEMSKKDKKIVTNATSDTSYINLMKMQRKGLIEIVNDFKVQRSNTIYVNNVAFEANEPKLQEELNRINCLLEKLYEQRRLKGIEDSYNSKTEPEFKQK